MRRISEGIPPEELPAIRDRHVPSELSDSGECAECLRPLPCDVLLLLDEVERLRTLEPEGPMGRPASPMRAPRPDRAMDFSHALWCRLNSGGQCDCQALSA
jgi:hypothetical protein